MSDSPMLEVEVAGATQKRPVVRFVAGAVGALLLAFLVMLAFATPGGADSASTSGEEHLD